MLNNYFVIEYQSGPRGCPVYFNYKLNQDWQWDEFDGDPDKFHITGNYICQAKHQVVDFDFLNEVLVSERFVDLCGQFGMKYRKIPVEINQSTKQPTDKKYYFFLAKTWLAILDMERSDCQISKDLETGAVVYNKFFPETPYVEAIKRAVIDEKKVLNHDIFRCIDIEMKYVCSGRFKDACEKKHLLGLKFVPIDEDFKFIPHWMEST